MANGQRLASALVVITALTVLLVACGGGDDGGGNQDGGGPATNDMRELRGQIRLRSELDGQRYCIDAFGLPDEPQFSEVPMWAYTCKDDPDPDQLFDTNYRARQVYAEAYERCWEATSGEANAAVRLQDCDDPTLQGFAFSDDGTVRRLSSAPQLCLAVGDEDATVVDEEAGELARALSLQPCDTVDDSLSRWELPDAEDLSSPDFTLSSPSFANDEPIPLRHSRCLADFSACTPVCQGENVPPEVSWTGAPTGTVAFALIVEDPDPERDLSWVVYDIDAGMASLPEGLGGPDGDAGVTLGRTGERDLQIGWLGPCPLDQTGVHTYVFTLYALSEELDLGPEPATAVELRAAMAGLIIDTTTLSGTFESRS